MRIQKTTDGKFEVTLSAADRRKLLKIVTELGPRAKLETIGRYKSFDDDKWWHLLVGQVAVMGGSRGLENARKDPKFDQAMRLESCVAAPDPAKYIADVLHEFGATRFWQKAADKLSAAVRNGRIVRGGRVVLCEGLTHKSPRDAVRATLTSHPALFKLKSASDFMIGAGLSHDVIAFDARVVGLLNETFDLNASAGRVQSNSALYFALEDQLRRVCDEVGSRLATLDRAIYQFRGKPEMKKVLK